MSQLDTVLLVALVLSLLVNGWLGSSAYSRWKWKRNKAKQGPRASQQYGQRGGSRGGGGKSENTKGWQGSGPPF